jgi:hypothetical protein
LLEAQQLITGQVRGELAWLCQGLAWPTVTLSSPLALTWTGPARQGRLAGPAWACHSVPGARRRKEEARGRGPDPSIRPRSTPAAPGRAERACAGSKGRPRPGERPGANLSLSPISRTSMCSECLAQCIETYFYRSCHQEVYARSVVIKYAACYA